MPGTREPLWCCLCGQRHESARACDPRRVEALRKAWASRPLDPEQAAALPLAAARRTAAPDPPADATQEPPLRFRTGD